MSYRSFDRSPTARQIRRRNERRLGFALLAFSVICTIGLIYGAYRVDLAHGITVSQSLASHGF